MVSFLQHAFMQQCLITHETAVLNKCNILLLTVNEYHSLGLPYGSACRIIVGHMLQSAFLGTSQVPTLSIMHCQRVLDWGRGPLWPCFGDVIYCWKRRSRCKEEVSFQHWQGAFPCQPS